MKKQFALIAVAVLFLASACGTFGSSSRGDTTAPLRGNEDVVHGTLENGLSWMVMENTEPENRIQLRLVVRAGSVLEDEDQKGIAHLVEHMAFKGTKSFDKEDLVDYFETIGMAFGPEVNAYTSFDETVYKLEIPADDPAILDRSLAILREWADSLTFPPEELERERSIVIEEWRVGRGANQRVRDRQIPVLFKGMPYADRLPIGDPEVIRTLDRERIIDFYRDWYRPELMTVIAVGDTDPVHLQKKIQETFSKIPLRENPRPRPEAEPPFVDDQEILVVRDPEVTYTTVQLLQHIPVQQMLTEQNYRQRLVESIAFSVFNSRLSEKTISAEPPFLGAQAGVWALVPSLRLSWLWMAPSSGRFGEAFEELLFEFERMKAFGVTRGELEREKTAMLEQMRKAWQDRDKITSSNHANSLVQSVLYNEPYLSLDTRYSLYQQFLPKITSDEITAVINALYPGRGTILFTTASDNAHDIPSEQELAFLWEKAATNRPVTPYEEASLDRPLFPEDGLSQNGTVVSREELTDGGIVELVLSNGARVLFHPTSFRENEVLFSAFSRGGSSRVPDEDYPSAYASVEYLVNSGLNGFDPVSLQKKLSPFSVSVTPWLQESYEGLSGRSTRDDIEVLFQLINLHFTQPDFTDAGWSSLVEQLRTAARNRRSRPEEQFNDLIREILYGKKTRFYNLNLELVEAMDRTLAERIYRERFSGADDFVFIFTGSFDEKEITELAEKYIANLPGVGVREDAVSIRPPFPSGVVHTSLAMGLEPKSMVFIGFGGEEPLGELDYEIFAQFRALVDLRLRESVREALGGSYGVWVGGSRTGYPEGRYALQIQFGCEPGREEELTRAVLSELASLRENPVPETELIKLREQYRRSQETGLQNNSYWHSRLTQMVMRRDPLRLITDTDAVLSRITSGVLQEQARRYIDPENYISAWLLPAENQDVRAEGQPIEEPVPAEH